MVRFSQGFSIGFSATHFRVLYIFCYYTEESLLFFCFAGTSNSPQEMSHNNSSHHGGDYHASQSKPADRVRCTPVLSDDTAKAIALANIHNQNSAKIHD